MDESKRFDFRRLAGHGQLGQVGTDIALHNQAARPAGFENAQRNAFFLSQGACSRAGEEALQHGLGGLALEGAGHDGHAPVRVAAGRSARMPGVRRAVVGDLEGFGMERAEPLAQ